MFDNCKFILWGFSNNGTNLKNKNHVCQFTKALGMLCAFIWKKKLAFYLANWDALWFRVCFWKYPRVFWVLAELCSAWLMRLRGSPEVDVQVLLRASPMCASNPSQPFPWKRDESRQPKNNTIFFLIFYNWIDVSFFQSYWMQLRKNINIIIYEQI